MNITLKSQFNLQEIVKDKVYNLNYGNLKKGSDTNAIINIAGVTFLSFKKSCGCTNPSIVLNLDNSFDVNIAYNNTKIGVINQWVKIKIQEQEDEIVFNLKGTIL